MKSNNVRRHRAIRGDLARAPPTSKFRYYVEDSQDGSNNGQKSSKDRNMQARERNGRKIRCWTLRAEPLKPFCVIPIDWRHISPEYPAFLVRCNVSEVIPLSRLAWELRRAVIFGCGDERLSWFRVTIDIWLLKRRRFTPAKVNMSPTHPYQDWLFVKMSHSEGR
jgi:hypothetical protein